MLKTKPDRKVEAHVSIEEEENNDFIDLQMPLDISFRNLLTPTDIFDEIPNLPKYKHLNGSKIVTDVVRLNNNTLNDLNGLEKVLEKIVKNPEDIAWMDLSFNTLSNIDDVLTKYPNLRIIYLHGNCISNFEEIEKLRALPHLIKLTLHGNPIEPMKEYRQKVLSILPNLKTFDFSGVTKTDRFKVDTMSTSPRSSRKNKSKMNR